jgi:hypothetical protein
MKKILFFSIVLMQVTISYSEVFLLERGGEQTRSNVRDSEGNLIARGGLIKKGDLYTKDPMVAIKYKRSEIRGANELIKELTINRENALLDGNSSLIEQNSDDIESLELFIADKSQEIYNLKSFLSEEESMKVEEELMKEAEDLTEEEEELIEKEEDINLGW